MTQILTKISTKLGEKPEHLQPVLFCKSYAGDRKRVERLIRSIERFNQDALPLYISIPEKDYKLFSDLENISSVHASVITDEEIIESNPAVKVETIVGWDGRKSQQVIKSEFWRYWLKANPDCENLTYICIDSESEFLRDFYKSDFIDLDEVPRTICHDHSDLLELARLRNKKKVIFNFRQDCALLKTEFGRMGPDYAFSPTPVIWSSTVWKDLDDFYLKPRGLTIWDAIHALPNELHWYGEALLKFKSIPLRPIKPLFRVYHFEWEFFTRQKQGETNETISKNFLGVLKQSNWDFEMDYGAQAKRKSVLSKLYRQMRRWITRCTS